MLTKLKKLWKNVSTLATDTPEPKAHTVSASTAAKYPTTFGSANQGFVRLLCDIPDGNGVKVSRRQSKASVPYIKGTIVQMSLLSAEKYVARGWAEWISP